MNRQAKHIIISTLLVMTGSLALGQGQAALRNANKLYKASKFQDALPEYQKAIDAGISEPSTFYNLGNAYFKNQKYDESAKEYNKIISKPNTKSLQQKAWYNTGVVMSKQKKLEASIENYKQALRMNATDNDARANLQKALEELRKKTPPDQNKQDQDNQKNKQKQQQNKPQQPPPSKLTKKQVEQLLKALQQREQQVQQKLQQNKNRAGGKPDKDW